MKVHLGCGANILDGWVNVDIGIDDPRVLRGDVRHLDSLVEDNSATIIYACHVFEHVARAAQLEVLAHWHAKLEPGGACYVSVPDFNYLVTQYLRALGDGEQWWTDDKSIIQPIMGGFNDGTHDEFNHHKSLFDYRHLRHLMEAAGFVDVRRYEPSEMGFNPNDHSGRPLSLNVVGFRAPELVG